MCMSPMSNWEFPKDCPKLQKYKRQAALGPGNSWASSRIFLLNF